MKRISVLWTVFGVWFFTACAQDKPKLITVGPEEPQTEEPSQPTEYAAAQWTATYATGDFAFESQYPAFREDRVVGVFYFLWIGAHGYDVAENHNDVQRPKSTDTKSPYDNQVLLSENPTNPQYGPVHAFHHWGKPYFDYYVSNDRWVIRKHAQMLSDAGVDVIFIDVTNGLHYLPIVNVLCEEYMAMRASGQKTPQIAFILNSSAAQTLNTLYTQFYQPGKYKELWFIRDGRPLVLCPDDAAIPNAQKSFFTTRYAWFDSRQPWFGDGVNKWTWGDLYPQNPGKNSRGANEQLSVAPATHPMANIGRSFDGSSQPVNPSESASGAGTYFKLQTDRALQVDPEIVFITGWNEWIAMRFIDGASNSFLGRPIQVGETYFVDQYNHEYSRDIEPVDGPFGDNYYYYMADFIRKYKGVSPVEADNTIRSPLIDGSFDDWKDVAAVYNDDKGDVLVRNHHGYGRVGELTNATARNDIVEARVAADGEIVYFYVKTATAITQHTDPRWMRLFIQVNGGGNQSWEGFDFVVNNVVNSGTSTVLERSTGGWAWQKIQDIDYRLSGNEMELAIPLSTLGITSSSGYTLDFKWVDNAIEMGDIMSCMRDGDSAPNSRFRYRYVR